MTMTREPNKHIHASCLSLAQDWPGKSDKEGNEHPAIWHMLDVGTCAERLIDGHRAFASLSQDNRNALVVLVALHDVGKISETFRAMIRDRPQHLGTYRHWKLSDVLLTRPLDEILDDAFGGNVHARWALYAAVSGHHGGPERSNNRHEIARRKKAIGGAGEAAAIEWVSLLLELLPDGSLEGIDQHAAQRLSWALSGLTVASDWVASNTEWFPFAKPDLDPVDYLARARRQAELATALAGLDGTAVSTEKNGRDLTGLTALRPMQTVVESVDLPNGPVLAVIEDATGAGKTEAALILAHRMIASGRARGLFFALPTMATANAMFDRMTATAKRLFAGRPSLALAHGQAWLNKSFRQKTVGTEDEPTPDAPAGFRELVGAEDDPTPEAREVSCTRWLADDRRRSLLADVGVGTIDQALMGILPTRFATLRLFGLMDRVLIVDEAHSYDPYMRRQLETLLKMQAMSGGSAIVMTATLPSKMRQQYADAFRSGLGCPSMTLDHQAYPALVVVGAQAQARAVEPAPATCRSVRIERIDRAETALEQLVAGTEAGAACLWVRNAVDDAIEAVKALRERGCPASLLHARFAMGDRLRYEEKIVDRFGPNGTGRAGQALVATQVVEASLDLDFDVMVSDLAPVGSLIQRAGRLWRHMDQRPATERPVPGPTLTVLSPDPARVTDDRWLKEILGRGAYVYRIDDQWQTAQAVFGAGEIREPDGLRALINAVHGSDAPDVPEPLQHATSKAEGDAHAEAALAQQNVVVPEDGYLKGTRGSVWSDEKFPTRLGAEEAILVLARHEGGSLKPWCAGDTPARGWALSEVRCARYRLPDELPDQKEEEIARIKKAWSKGRREYLTLCPVSEDGTICDGLQYDPEWGLRFSSRRE